MPEKVGQLTVGVQRGRLCIWALVDTDTPMKTRYFEIYGTGHQIPRTQRRYLGTVLLHEDALVLHVFEVVE